MSITITHASSGPVAANTYIIYDKNKNAVIIDPSALSFIKNTVNDLDLSVSAILITHGHFDHIWSLADACKFLSSPSVYIHSLDAPMLSDNSINGYQLLGGIRSVCFGSADSYVSDGQVLNFGDIKVEVIHTPGHSAGSVCYKIENCLFTGDTVFKNGIGRTDLYLGSYDQLSSSLKKLKSMFLCDDPILFPGHGEKTLLSDELEFI